MTETLPGMSVKANPTSVKQSNSDGESWMNATNSDQKSATGDCLMCSEMEEEAVKSAQKKFHKKEWASCSPTKWGLWRDAQQEQIGTSHQAVWGSDYEAIKIEWDLTLDKDYSSFYVGSMMVQTALV